MYSETEATLIKYTLFNHNLIRCHLEKTQRWVIMCVYVCVCVCVWGGGVECVETHGSAED